MKEQESKSCVCPLGNLDDAIKDGSKFYSPFCRKEPRPSPWTGSRPSFEEQDALQAGTLTEMTLDGEQWRRVPLDVTWELAADDVTFASTAATAEQRITPRHIHCEFEFQQKAVHIDYIRYVTWGPLSGFEEFKFYVDGDFRSRGGYSVLFGNFPRAMPACLRTREFAVIASKLEGSALPGLSAWLIGSKQAIGPED